VLQKESSAEGMRDDEVASLRLQYSQVEMEMDRLRRELDCRNHELQESERIRYVQDVVELVPPTVESPPMQKACCIVM